ncbi:MAG: aminopeptidase P family protein [Chloroflexi bacterium]|nr:MAG: aminopeptidase P family protein [Chloroflexota bacterium]
MSHDPVTQGFSQVEYQRRWDAVRAALPPAGLDALCVTAPLRLEWLSGADGSGMWPDPLILAPGQPVTLVVRRYEEDRVRTTGRVERIVSYFGEDDALDVWAETLREMGLDSARLGLELDCWGLAPRDVSELQRRLPRLTVLDASRIAGDVMDVKSDEELAVMRAAAAYADIGMQAFFGALHAGALESDVAATTLAAMRAAGSEPMPFGATILLGQNSAVPHGASGTTRLQPGDVAFAEFGGVCHGYCAGLVRSAVLGNNPAAEALYAVARRALEAGLGAIRPGATTGAVDAAVRGVVTAAGYAAAFRHRSGYAIGLGWQDRGNTSLKPGGSTILRPGMTLHLPVNLFAQGEFCVGCSETVLVTSDGAEPLGRLPRDLVWVG